MSFVTNTSDQKDDSSQLSSASSLGHVQPQILAQSQAPPAVSPPHTTAVASLQHQQEQEMLLNYTVPNPPVSTQQSSAAASAVAAASAAAMSNSQANSSVGNYGQDGQNQTQHASFDADLNKVNPPRTLWMGDLDPWLEEAAIADLWWQVLGKKVTVKIIKPKIQQQHQQVNENGLTHSGYCFIEFETFDDAQQALGLNGQLLPDIAIPSQQKFLNNPDNQKKYFRLNWASGATLSAPIIQTPEYSLFVGDLSASTTEAHLLAFFQKSFPNSIKTVRVMTDPVTGKSRCFGFVRFADESHRQMALVELQGAWFGGRPLRLALATPRNSNRQQQNHNQQHQYQQQQSFQQQHHFQQGHHFHQDQQFQQPRFTRSPLPQGNYFYGGYDQQNQELMGPGVPGASGGTPGGPGPGPGNYYQHQWHDPRAQQVNSPIPPPPVQPQGNYQEQLQQQLTDTSDTSSIKSPVLTATQTGNSIGPSSTSSGGQGQNQTQDPPSLGHGQPFTDPNNTTVFVGGLSSEVNEPTLFMLFKPFGLIQQVKIPPGKNCGFIKYSTRVEAEDAIAAMQGFIIGGNRVRLSWGRVSLNNKKYQQQQQQVAQAAQIEAAAALSMGLDPASAIAAAAAAAAGGYTPTLPGHVHQPPPPGAAYHMMHPVHAPPPPHMGMPPPIHMQNYQPNEENREEKQLQQGQQQLPHQQNVPNGYLPPVGYLGRSPVPPNASANADGLLNSMANMNLGNSGNEENPNYPNPSMYLQGPVPGAPGQVHGPGAQEYPGMYQYQPYPAPGPVPQFESQDRDNEGDDNNTNNQKEESDSETKSKSKDTPTGEE